MAKKLKTYIYDCDMGQGSVEAFTLIEATKAALREAGTVNGVHNVRLPSREELSFRKSMGGRV